MSQLVVLDNEAVQALGDPAHRKHRRVVSQAQVVASRKRRAAAIEMVVPTAVRVEAGWDRTSSAWAFPNHLRIADAPLDTSYANIAAAIRNQTGVSIADAHLGAVIQSISADQIAVVTSDPGDMCLVAGDKSITIVAI
jgi:predicted nucleic acid-binding protein